MPVSLDKTPAPQPEDMDRAPAYRVELRKLTAPFFVVADTRGQWTQQTGVDVLSAERAADNDVERSLQRMDIQAQCIAAPGVVYIELYAVSAGQAAGLAVEIIHTAFHSLDDALRLLRRVTD